MTPRSTLHAIRADDPDGWANKPTNHDYDIFKIRTINSYGLDAWQDYNTNWDSYDEDWA